MEFVLVTFPTLRPVRMDGARQGQTGQIIGVQRGTHIFDLGSPRNYAPPSVETIVASTSQMQPLVIPFQPAALPVAVPGPPTAGASRAASRPPGRSRAKKAAGKKKRAAPQKAAPAAKKTTRKRSRSKKVDGRKKGR